LAIVALAACAYAALPAPLGADYPGPPCRGCDYAGPPIDALSRSHLAGFFDSQPFMGPFTLLLRAPVVAVARAAGGGELSQYRLGALACLFVAAAFSLLVVSRMPARRWRWLLQAVLLGLILAGPLTLKALWWGHPEEVVGGVLCVGAVVLAGEGQPALAGLLLGLAVATKQWALLAVLPALIVSTRSRSRLLVVAAGVAALFLVPMLIGDANLFVSQNLHAGVEPGASTAGVMPTDIWWAYATQVGSIVGGGSSYGIPATLAALAHPLVLAVGVVLSVIFWLRRRTPTAADALLLLALVFLVRCLLDPLTISYHHVPFFVAIATAEGLRRRGLPVVTLVSAAAMWALARWVAPTGSSDLLNELYLLWATPVAAYLAIRCFLPDLRPWRALVSRVRSARSPMAVPAAATE